VPITEAAKRGVSWLNETAGQRRVMLTRFGRVDSVIDSAERLDASAETIAAAARAVVEHVAGDSLNPGATYSLDAVCDKLGLDVARVQARAAQLRG